MLGALFPDGTRAGIIDQTITVTFFPSLFGSDNLPAAQASGSGSSRMFSGDGTSMGYPLISSTTPHTPHPFLNYQTPGASSFSHADQSGFSQPHSPTTPFSLSSLWGSSSRPHTPGYAGNSAIRPFSSVPQSVYASNTPLSVNGEDFEGAEQRGGGALVNGASSSHFMTTEEAGGGQSTSSTSRPAMPAEALTPHWSAGGLGRGSLRGFIWGLLHPRAALRSLCSIQLRLLSRLEFNDAGKIVRHEDTWGLREAIEGIIPLAPICESRPASSRTSLFTITDPTQPNRPPPPPFFSFAPCSLASLARPTIQSTRSSAES